jgi:hypothetical protein
LLRRVVSRRWPLLTLWGVAQWWLVSDHTGDWLYFSTAARAVFGGTLGHNHAAGGIHTYAHFPVQFGPPPIYVAELTRLSGGFARTLFGILIMALVLPTLRLLQEAAVNSGVTRQRAERTIFIGGILAMPSWGQLAFGYAHMDDALVLVSAAAAMYLISRGGCEVWAAIAAGTAAAAKPWGIVVLALLATPQVTRPLRALTLGTLVAAAWWGPFLLDPATITHGGSVQLPVSNGTVLRLLVPHAALSPLWVRPAQLLGGLTVSLLVARKSPASALLLGIALRLMLDPNNYAYYWAAIIIAALVADLATSNGWLPLTGATWLFSRAVLVLPATDTRAVAMATVLIAGCWYGVIAGTRRPPEMSEAARRLYPRGLHLDPAAHGHVQGRIRLRAVRGPAVGDR